MKERYQPPNPDQQTENSGEQKGIEFAESLELAKELSNKYFEEIHRLALEKDPFGRGLIGCLNSIPSETLSRYKGHGIIKGEGSVGGLAIALNIMANQTIKGWAGPPVPGPLSAYVRGDFLIVSKRDESLMVVDRDGEGERTSHLTKNGWKANIGAVIIHPKYHSMLPELRSMFPEMNIVEADHVAEYFTE